MLYYMLVSVKSDIQKTFGRENTVGTLLATPTFASLAFPPPPPFSSRYLSFVPFSLPFCYIPPQTVLDGHIRVVVGGTTKFSQLAADCGQPC
jgi:hypothetical protein